MSSNPFRKKALEAIETTRVQSPVMSSLRSNSPLGSDGAPPGRPRIVKKVRVLSPPPLSPESPEWPENVNRGGYPRSVYRGPSGVSWSADESDPRAESTAPTPPPLTTSAVPASNAAPPANPFSKTLQAPEESKDMENQRKSEGAALKAGNLARHSLNVDSFKRLLLTGKINDPEPVLATDSPARNDPTTLGDPTADHLDAGETTQRDQEDDASSVSETSSADNSDRQVGPVSASSPDKQHFGREKKAPPPSPSSRHVKSLRDASKLGLPTDINKPLPLSPVRTSTDDGAGSPSDPETVSKVLDQLPEHESERVAAEPQRDAATHPSSSRRLAPAPPPPRQRGSSSGSLDVLPRRVSSETASEALAEEQLSPDSGKGDDILADLDALQREVDALRGQVH